MDHGTPSEGMECACCYDDIMGGSGGNYVEYRTGEGKKWLPSLFCKTCVEVLLKNQWRMYEESLSKATCKAQQKRMLREGPPTHIKDKKALECGEGESVHSLWFVGDDGGEPQVQSALLEGAPQGKARQIWWDEKLAFQFDEDDDEEVRMDEPEETAAAASTLPPVPGSASPPPVPPPPAAPVAVAATVASQAAGEDPRAEAEAAGAIGAGAIGAPADTLPPPEKAFGEGTTPPVPPAIPLS